MEQVEFLRELSPKPPWLTSKWRYCCPWFVWCHLTFHNGSTWSASTFMLLRCLPGPTLYCIRLSYLDNSQSRHFWETQEQRLCGPFRLKSQWISENHLHKWIVSMSQLISVRDRALVVLKRKDEVWCAILLLVCCSLTVSRWMQGQKKWVKNN